MSSVLEEIESKAVKIVEEAKRKAQEIVEEAKRKAQEILEDKNYIRELELYRAELEYRARIEVEKIMKEGEEKILSIKSTAEKKINDIARQMASFVAGV